MDTSKVCLNWMVNQLLMHALSDYQNFSGWEGCVLSCQKCPQCPAKFMFSCSSPFNMTPVSADLGAKEHMTKNESRTIENQFLQHSSLSFLSVNWKEVIGSTTLSNMIILAPTRSGRQYCLNSACGSSQGSIRLIGGRI